MAFPPFRRVQVGKFGDVVRMQDNVATAVNKINRVDFLDGVRLTGVSLSSGTNQIDHKLSRQPLGWVITDQTAAAGIYRVSWDSKLLTLSSDANTTVDIWIF